MTATAAETPSLLVTLATDTVDDADNQTSLREAIAYAGTLGGSNTITFAPALGGATLTLSSGTPINGNAGGLTLDATALSAGLTLASTGANRVVLNTSTLTLRWLTLSGAAIAGG